jgi:hypothetical protein
MHNGAACWYEGHKLPYFKVILARRNKVWTQEEFRDFANHPVSTVTKWPAGTRDKVPQLCLEIGATWADANEERIRETAVRFLKWKVEHYLNRLSSDGLSELIAQAIAIDRADMLKPVQPSIEKHIKELMDGMKKIRSSNRRIASFLVDANRTTTT